MTITIDTSGGTIEIFPIRVTSEVTHYKVKFADGYVTSRTWETLEEALPYAQSVAHHTQIRAEIDAL
jgi:hypothetical protein